MTDEFVVIFRKEGFSDDAEEFGPWEQEGEVVGYRGLPLARWQLTRVRNVPGRWQGVKRQGRTLGDCTTSDDRDRIELELRRRNLW
jgi:hypothetical protein